jgi:Ca2+-binding RTX toxin-like protein
MLVNTTTAGDQERCAVVALAKGGWIVSWEGNGDGDTDGIYQRRYDENGVALGDATLVNATTTHDQFSTTLVALKDGGWLTSWSGEDAGFSTDIYLQRYNKSGKVILSETVVNHNTAGSQTDSSITVLGDGGWLVTWAGEGPGDTSGIFQRRYDKSGGTSGADILVNADYATGNQYGPAVTTLADGGWLVAWYGAGADDPDGIYQQRYNKQGTAVDGPTLVNTYTTFNQYSPSVISLDDGGWLVAWYGYGQDDANSTGVYFRHYDKHGKAVGKDDTLVNTITDGTQSSPSVTELADGGWVVTWQSPDKNQTSIYDIYQQRYDGNGHTVGTQTFVNADTKGSQLLPQVTALADGSWVVSWHGPGTGDTDGIYQRHFAADVVGGAKADKLNGTGWGELLAGNSGNDKIDGKAGDDILNGGKGADSLTGGAGVDTFTFKNGDGADTIKGFVAKGADHDVIDLSQVSGIKDFADLRAHHMDHTASSVTIDYGAHDVITLAGVTLKSLSAADFLL